MWEISLSINKENEQLLSNIFIKASALLKDKAGVAIFDTTDVRAFLTLACENEHKTMLCDFLADEITKIYIDDFKYAYLQKNAKLPTNNPINYNAFMRALVSFDSEFDREIVENKLKIENGLMLEGFFNFKLKELKARWKEVSDLANENAGYLSYQDTFIELMRFLINTIDCKSDEIIIETTDDGYKIFDCAKMEAQYASNETLVSSIINLSPNIINVYEDNPIPENIMNMISSLYDKRIKTIQLT